MTKSRGAEILGMFAATLTTGAFAPQVIKMWKMAPVPAVAVSLQMYVILNVGILCWLVYGFMIKSRPVIAANAVTLILALSILVYKCIYG